MVGRVDWKTLGRPPTFTGDEGEWNEWSFVMRSYLATVHAHGAPMIEVAEARDEPEVNLASINATLGEEGKTSAKRIYYS